MKPPFLAPSLSRLVQYGLAGAFVLVLIVFATRTLLQFQAQMETQSGELPRYARLIGDALDESDDVTAARALLRYNERMFAQTIIDSSLTKIAGPAPAIFSQLARNEGAMLYTSHPSHAWIEQPPDSVQRVEIDGHSYWVYAHEGQRWRLRFGLPYFAWQTVFLAGARDLLPELAIYCPMIMLLAWLSLRLGLRPLRQLCAALRERAPDDLSPLTIRMRYKELQQVADAWNAQLERIRHALAREREFMHDAAHELRTPMAVMSTQAHVLLRAENETERQAAEKAMQDAIARAAHLAAQLLSLAAMDHAQLRDSESLDLAHLLQAALAQKVHAAQGKGLELALNAPESLPCASNRVALHSIIDNLIDNAIRYGRSGGRIEVTLGEDGNGISLDVADDGPGIPAPERERVFERFYRLDRTQSGTGLGLPIVQHAVHNLGGHLEIGDGLGGRGVAFRIVLPHHTPAAGA